MPPKLFLKIRLYFTALVAIAIGSLLLWNHYHGGVPSHHILQRKDLPEISNWWGGLLLPLLSWFLLHRIQKRICVTAKENAQVSQKARNVLYAFLGALSFGTLLATFFTFGNTEMPFYMLIGALLLALFVPIYRAECLLGFVIGMTFTFGAVLPTGIGTILALLGAAIYLGIRPTILFITKKSMDLVTSKK
jgi:MFS family permease